MQATFEQAVEIVSTLPPSDLQKLGRWIQSKQKKPVLSEQKRSEAEEEIEKFKLAMRWINEHRQQYLGQWVCLDGDNLIGHGDDAVKIHTEAKAKGIRAPFVEHVVEEPEAYLGGWEACQ